MESGSLGGWSYGAWLPQFTLYYVAVSDTNIGSVFVIEIHDEESNKKLE